MTRVIVDSLQAKKSVKNNPRRRPSPRRRPNPRRRPRRRVIKTYNAKTKKRGMRFENKNKTLERAKRDRVRARVKRGGRGVGASSRPKRNNRRGKPTNTYGGNNSRRGRVSSRNMINRRRVAFQNRARRNRSRG